MSDGTQRDRKGRQELLFLTGGRTGARNLTIRRAWALFLIAALCLFGGRRTLQHVETNTRRTMRAALDATGHGWVQFEISGRRVHLAGAAPSETAADSAVAIVRQTMCPSPARSQRCASRISSGFGGSELAWPDLLATIERGVMTLSGVVPDAGVHWAVLDRARGAVRLGKIRRVVDEMTLSGGGAPVGVDAAAARLGEATALCESGGATLTKGVLSVRCHVSDSLATRLRELVRAPMQSGYLGELQLTVTADTSAQDDG